MTVKRRSTMAPTVWKQARLVEKPLGTVLYTGPKEVYQSFATDEIVVSKGNPYQLLGKTSADIGGAFSTGSIRFIPAAYPLDSESVFSGNVYWQVKGICRAQAAGLGAGSSYLTRVTPSSQSQMNAIGTSLIARATPTNPLVDMGQFLGELRQSIGLLKPVDIRAALTNFRNLGKPDSSVSQIGVNIAGDVGNAYLAYEFGYLPFMRSIMDATRVYLKQSAHIKRLHRNSGRNIRRRVSLPSSVVTTNSVVGTNQPPFPTPETITQGGTLRLQTVTETKRWFSGCFTYYLPDVARLSELDRFMLYARRLYGVRLDPELVYDLTPWSWLADWIGTFGDIIHNWSAFQTDGLVMRYGYVMEEIRKTEKYFLDGVRLGGRPLPTLMDTFVTVSKQRTGATPYGFGLNPSSFSTKQRAIIVALGIQQVRQI